jgi:hypothetical protein
MGSEQGIAGAGGAGVQAEAAAAAGGKGGGIDTPISLVVYTLLFCVGLLHLEKFSERYLLTCCFMAFCANKQKGVLIH